MKGSKRDPILHLQIHLSHCFFYIKLMVMRRLWGMEKELPEEINNVYSRI